MEQLFVGVGRENITPEIGTMLMGYALRPALKINDNLHTTAFAFSYGDTKAMLISCDACVLREDGKQMVYEELCRQTGLSEEQVIIACTHTHSAPTTQVTDGEEFNYVRDLLRYAVAKAAKAALENLRPAQMGIGTTMSNVGVNRREIKEDGTVVLGQCPYGTYDPQMTVVSFREPNGTPIGNLIHYGCHNTGSGWNDAVTRDWCGVAIDRLEEQSGGITAFINGGAGDVGPRLANGKTTGNLQLALELGGQAAVDAVRAWRSIKVWENAPLKVISGDIRVPSKDVGTEQDALAQLAALGDPETAKRTKTNMYRNLTARVEFLRAGKTPPEYQLIPNTFIALGPLVLQGIPFEPFSMITLRIKEHSPYPHTLCVGYADSIRFYFASMDQIIRGGYEVNLFKNIFMFPFTDDMEQYYVQGSLEWIRKLYHQDQ